MRVVTDVCDRCGKEYKFLYKFINEEPSREWDGFQMFKKNRSRGKDDTKKFIYGKKLYLCSECQEELESWAFEEKDDDRSSYESEEDSYAD